MGQILSTGWTLEQSDALVAFVQSGLSYAQSAAALNEQFGTSYSRNSAIGRANRIGLACPIKIAQGRRSPRKHQPYKPRPKKPRIAFVPIEVIRARCEEIIPENVPLVDLSPNGCRFPFGDGPFVFCNHTQMEGSSYCPPHFGLSRRAMS